jgi:hypothetical protein
MSKDKENLSLKALHPASTDRSVGVQERKTERGFSRIEFTDLYGVKCSLQKSSLATADAIWFGCNDADPKVLAPGPGWQPVPMPDEYIANTRMHLTAEMVSVLLPYLNRFAETGELNSPNPKQMPGEQANDVPLGQIVHCDMPFCVLDKGHTGLHRTVRVGCKEKIDALQARIGELEAENERKQRHINELSGAITKAECLEADLKSAQEALRKIRIHAGKVKTYDRIICELVDAALGLPANHPESQGEHVVIKPTIKRGAFRIEESSIGPKEEK